MSEINYYQEKLYVLGSQPDKDYSQGPQSNCSMGSLKFSWRHGNKMRMHGICMAMLYLGFIKVIKALASKHDAAYDSKQAGFTTGLLLPKHCVLLPIQFKHDLLTTATTQSNLVTSI